MPAPEQTTGSLRPRTPISDLLRALEARRDVTLHRRADYLDVRVGGAGGVGLYVHEDRVSIAVAPEHGYEVEARAPFALQIPRTPAVAYVVVGADGVGSHFDDVLDLALEALDWRACGQSAEFCAHCGVGCATWHDTCPNCWLEVDEQGRCGCATS
jgi:hypothetical protein